MTWSGKIREKSGNLVYREKSGKSLMPYNKFYQVTGAQNIVGTTSLLVLFLHPKLTNLHGMAMGISSVILIVMEIC